MKEGSSTRLCPLCGRENHCGKAMGTPGSCWCETIVIPENLALLLEKLDDRTSCVCRACVEYFSRAQA